MGGDIVTCLKCINVTDVAISAVMGAIAPTWLGDVRKAAFALRNASALRQLGGPGLGGVPAQALKNNVKGAAAANISGAAIKSIFPNNQIECDDVCARYRLTAPMMGLIQF